MNKVLIISYYFPPMGMGGVQRTLKFAKYLPQFGWQPVVITDSPKKYFAVDESLLDEALRSNIIIERTGKEKFNPKNIQIKAPAEKFRKLRSTLSQFIFVPDSKIGFKKKALKKIDEIWDSYGGFDLVYSTAPPYTDHLIGLEVKKRYNIPLVLDYRDAWVDSPVLNYYPTSYHKLKNIRLEKSVIGGANKVITTNRRVKEYIIARYGNIEYNDVRIIPHGYDTEDFEIASREPMEKPKRMRITYSGSFYTRDPGYYFDAIKLLFDKFPELKDKIEFCFIGHVTEENRKLIKEYGIADNVVLTGYLNHIDCVRYIMSSDILFLLISRGENEDAAMPGKVGEYIGSRKPIIACIPEGVTKKYLENYGAITFIPDEDSAEIVKAVLDYYELYKKGELPKPDEAVVTQFDRKKMTEELATEFNYLLSIE
ncbi:MAG: glycosyltransferase family 4 protein [Ignavibacteriae bacterium]|nr:glycosyltransferase family 4 protein [Ignavibacteriota bacterium]MCB9242821.1 glycosyltransferase family 4 protein [Ignavibacteriales bacterium]